MNRSTFFLALFALVCLAELIAVALGMLSIQWVVKPLIMLSLITYFIVSTSSRPVTFILALVFCWAGDVLLLFQGDDPLFFMLGLAAFLIGHIGYILSYRQFQWSDRTNELLSTQKIRYSLSVVLIGTGLITILFPNLGGLKVPVFLYAIVLTLMVMTAIFRYGRTTPSSFWLIFWGAALFMLSDSLLAINKFYSPIAQSGLLIMSTYMAAQYMIVQGALLHLAKMSSIK